ncbi:hypothetical protein MASR2M39_17470 [Ignavibacteriales bacterium]
MKQIKSPEKEYSIYDLLGNNEMALSQAFAHLLASDEESFKCFFRDILGEKYLKKNTFENAEIGLEKHSRDDGRTDIEIKSEHYHVIIEIKIKNNPITGQISQYLKRFDEDAKSNHFVGISNIPSLLPTFHENIKFHNISWMGIFQKFQLIKEPATQLNPSLKEPATLLHQFVLFFERNYFKMQQKEILVQDLANQNQIKLLDDSLIYKRDKVVGIPLYYAPYFTQGSGIEPGISRLYRVLAVFYAKTDEENWLIQTYDYLEKNVELKNVKEDILNKWKAGLKTIESSGTGFNFYFLDEPVTLPFRVLKGNKIMNQIPKNYSITFKELFQEGELSQSRN